MRAAAGGRRYHRARWRRPVAHAGRACGCLERSAMNTRAVRAMAARLRGPWTGPSLAAGWRGSLSVRTRRWPSQLDFRPMRPRPAPWAWAMLVAGLLSVLWLADQAEHLQQRQDEAQAQLKRLARADRQ